MLKQPGILGLETIVSAQQVMVWLVLVILRLEPVVGAAASGVVGTCAARDFGDGDGVVGTAVCGVVSA